MTDQTALDPLAAELGERLIRPGDARWDAARAPWALAVEQRPEAVAVPAGVEELRAVVRAARDGGLTVAVQPSGHGANGSLAGSILVRTDAFDDVLVDLDSRTARIGAGVRWNRLLRELAGSALIAPAGSSGVVSVAGLLLGGGHSWFSRSLGPAARSLRAVEMLTADGELLRIDDQHDPDLMRALRGAGGAFGAVTRLEVGLDFERMLYGGRLVFAPDQAAAVIASALDAGRAAPESVQIHTGFMRFPDAPVVPEELRGRRVVQVDVVSRADAATTEAVLAPVRAAGTVVQERLRSFGIEALEEVADEPTDPSPAGGWSGLLADADTALVERVLDVFDRPEAAALVGFDVRVLGGAMARDEGPAAVAGAVAEPFVLHTIAFGPPDAQQAAIGTLREAVGESWTGHSLPSFLSPGDGYGAAYGAGTVEGLREVKARVDPHDVFVGNRAFE
ncbi:FAD-binding oxidoreductase [Agromyces archimandritae]|uniref:FAD-binding oxidoreductase n=1 Tax=Agromyces archimandritae TaxID=2781962 RepID=UPI001FD5F37A|nr:FAD-binding oxidoreductase [Agromyces archimandritae]